MVARHREASSWPPSQVMGNGSNEQWIEGEVDDYDPRCEVCTMSNLTSRLQEVGRVGLLLMMQGAGLLIAKARQ